MYRATGQDAQAECSSEYPVLSRIEGRVQRGGLALVLEQWSIEPLCSRKLTNSEHVNAFSVLTLLTKEGIDQNGNTR